MVSPAKRELLLRHRNELNALHTAQYAERLVHHDQWRVDPRYFSLYLYCTVLQNQHTRHKAE